MTEHLSNGQFASKEVTETKVVAKRKGNPNWVPGHAKVGGRALGTPNKITRDVKEFLAELVADTEVQGAVKGRIIKGDAVAFFRALEQVVGKPSENVNLNMPGIEAIMARLVAGRKRTHGITKP